MTLPWSPDYDTPAGWQAIEQAAPGRIIVTSPPGYASKAKPQGNVMRVELRPGDVWRDGDGYTAPRAEVYARHAVPGATPADRWPDPPGSERWYDLTVLVPTGHQFATDARWLTITQWKGYRGGGPPLALEVKRGDFVLGGRRGGHVGLGVIRPGHWTRFTVGIQYAVDGWVEVHRDGVSVLPRRTVASIDLIDGRPDPVYLKQGIYRDTAWTVPHVLYFGPTKVGTSRSDVA